MSAIGEGATRSESELRLAMAQESERIETWARTWDSTYRRLARDWARANSLLVASSALLAAGAGATGLGNVWSGSLGPGLLALGAAVVSGVATALGASARATQYNTSAASNSGLADAARAFRTTVVEYQLIADVSTKFDALCRRRDTVVRSAPVSGSPKPLESAETLAWPRRPGRQRTVRDGSPPP